MSNAELLRVLRQRINDEVGRAVRPGPIALLDFPNYANPGDSAIWLGALTCLSELGFAPPVYTSDHRTFDERALARALPTGTILLTGGGNLGDLWPGAQVLRERVLRAFPNHAIVQLPQTIHFGDPAARARARTAFAAHRDVTLLVRDAQSLEVALVDLGCRAQLCPDLALCLTPGNEPALRAERGGRARVDTIHLLRTDHESVGVTPGNGETWVDWTSDVRTPLGQIATRLGDYVEGTSASGPASSVGARAARATLSACYPALARARLRRGGRLLRSARIVVTDRLHGHILCLLLGIPHVVLDDRNSKLRRFMQAWTSQASLLRWADAPSDIPALVSDLLSPRAAITAT